MRLLPKSIHRCRRYPTKFNSGRDIPPYLVPQLFFRSVTTAQGSMTNEATIHIGSIGTKEKNPTFFAGGSWNAQ